MVDDKNAQEVASVEKSAPEEGSASMSQSAAGENEDGESPELINNHDLIGVEGIIRAQKNEIEKKKVRGFEVQLSRFVIVRCLLQLMLRIENEKYFREHPELQALTTLFIRKILDDRPENILQYAGRFFDRAELHEVVGEAILEEEKNEARNTYLNDLIRGKTLIE